MSAALTRRGLVQAGAAALGTMVAPVSASAVASPADLDAGLFALLDRWREARAAWDTQDNAANEAHDRARAVVPLPSDALRWRGRDFGYHLDAAASLQTIDATGRRSSFYGFDDVEKLRASEPVTRWALAEDSVQPPPREPDPEGEARRQEIIAAHDGWVRERKAVEDAIGYTSASELAEVLWAAWVAVDDALRLCEPRTVAGIVRKAAWVADCLSKEVGRDGLGEVFAHQVAAFGGVAS